MKPSLRSLHYSTNGEFKIFFSFSSRYHAGNWAPAIIDLLWAARTGERVPIQSSTLTKLQRHRKSFFPGGGRGRLFFTHKERRGGGICMLLGKEWEIGTCKKGRRRKIRNIYSRYVCGKWTQEQIPYPYLGACTKGRKSFFPFSSPGPKFEEAPPDFLSNQSHFSFLFFLSSQRRAKEGTFTAARQKEENSFEQLGGGFLGITFPPSSSAAHLSGYTVFHRFLIAKLAFYGPKNKNRLRPRLIFSAILFRIY